MARGGPGFDALGRRLGLGTLPDGEDRSRVFVEAWILCVVSPAPGDCADATQSDTTRVMGRYHGDVDPGDSGRSLDVTTIPTTAACQACRLAIHSEGSDARCCHRWGRFHRIESGRHVARRRAEVLIIDDLSSGSTGNVAEAMTAGAVLEQVDLRDGRRLRQVITAFAPTVVFHLAAQDRRAVLYDRSGA
jgi:hypothetical protein